MSVKVTNCERLYEREKTTIYEIELEKEMNFYICWLFYCFNVFVVDIFCCVSFKLLSNTKHLIDFLFYC